MVDLFGADKGNISLPPRLQPPEVLEGQTDDLKQVMILNMQKAFYEVRITDIAQRIQRLQLRNTELEQLCVAEKLLRSQTDIETADQIAQLNRQIFLEAERVSDYKKRMQALRKWMEEEKQAHLDKVEAANKKYDETRLAITSEIQVLNAKINTLEEYKSFKTDLRNKLIAGDDLIARRDEEAKQRLEQIQRKFKIGREKLKKEMYARLQGLAGTFQMEVTASMAKPIHRLMRENIFLKNELVDIVRESVPKKEKIKRTKVADEEIMERTVTTKNATVKELITSKIQGYLLTAVKEQHTRVKDCLEILKKFDIEDKMISVEFSYACTKIEADKSMQSISRLEAGLHRQQTRLGFANYIRDRSKVELQRCTDILWDAKYAVACALGMNETGKHLLEMEDKKLMSYLLDILSKGDIQKWKERTPSLVTTAFPGEAYKIGDLGCDVSNVELHDSRRTTLQKKPSKSSTSNVLALSISLFGADSDKTQIKSWHTDVTELGEESEDSTDEEDKITAESNLTLGGGEELEQSAIQPENVDEHEPEVDRGEEEEKVEDEEKIEKEEEETEDDLKEEAYNSEEITIKNGKEGSTMNVAENMELFSEGNERD